MKSHTKPALRAMPAAQVQISMPVQGVMCDVRRVFLGLCIDAGQRGWHREAVGRRPELAGRVGYRDAGLLKTGAAALDNATAGMQPGDGRKVATAAALGGVLGLLLGSRGGRRLGGKVVKLGSVVALGTLAWKAYGDWQRQNAAAGAPSAGTATVPAHRERDRRCDPDHLCRDDEGTDLRCGAPIRDCAKGVQRQ